MEANSVVKGKQLSPKRFRDSPQLEPGARFKFFFHSDGVMILPKIPTARLKCMTPSWPSRSIEEIDRAIESVATKRFRRCGS